MIISWTIRSSARPRTESASREAENHYPLWSLAEQCSFIEVRARAGFHWNFEPTSHDYGLFIIDITSLKDREEKLKVSVFWHGSKHRSNNGPQELELWIGSGPTGVGRVQYFVNKKGALVICHHLRGESPDPEVEAVGNWSLLCWNSRLQRLVTHTQKSCPDKLARVAGQFGENGHHLQVTQLSSTAIGRCSELELEHKLVLSCLRAMLGQ
ncbi:hypothetical protein Tco_1053979 [Tanacetum coccineum]|uniref:Uncharacterized protein n=1 Tax=Tanacetum coccineum TaxID=301880 RepID=A0ABQ5GVG5_9ASTR